MILEADLEIAVEKRCGSSKEVNSETENKNIQEISGLTYVLRLS